MRVVQETSSDCGPCCLAMLTGLTRADVIQLIGDAFDPERGLNHLEEALSRLGFARSTYKRFGAHSPDNLPVDYLGALLFGRRALLTVPSLNKAGGYHMLYWDSHTIWDPSPHRTYDKEALPPTLDGVLFSDLNVGPVENLAHIRYMLTGWANLMFARYNAPVYLVGSALYKRRPRDIDLRIVLSDADYTARFGDQNIKHDMRLRWQAKEKLWSEVCAKENGWIARNCNVNPDFQIQSAAEAQRYQLAPRIRLDNAYIPESPK